MVVDTSALMAILLGEPDAERCIAALEAQSQVMISAGSKVSSSPVISRISPSRRGMLRGFRFPSRSQNW